MWFAPALRPVSSGRSLLSVQVLRAIAALTVVVHHAGYDADALAAQAGLARLEVDRFFDWGFGIHLFFVISGFLLYRPFAASHMAGRPGPAVRAYFRRRALRILPAYWAALTIIVYVLHQQHIRSVYLKLAGDLGQDYVQGVVEVKAGCYGVVYAAQGRKSVKLASNLVLRAAALGNILHHGYRIARLAPRIAQ